MSAGDILLIIIAALVMTAIVVYVAAKISEWRNPPKGKFVTAGGVRLHYVERGAGDPIVLVHGNATMLEDYLTSGLVDRLAQRRRVILFDRPGFGYSERPRGVVWTAERQAAVIGEAMDMLGIRRATVVGHSWGTLVAVAMAEQEPQRVESLVLLSGL